jgi:hypothetical protein
MLFAMKKPTLIFTMFYLLIAGCTSKELSREEAFRLLQQQDQYPRIIDYDIYCSDPTYAKKAIDAGLEKEGLLIVQRTQKLADVGKPLIGFTEKAKPYLLATPPRDKAADVQKVKVADADLVEVTAVQTENDGKSAVVEFTTAYKNRTPFSVLTTIDFSGKATRKARLSLFDDGWRLQK